jgi:ABC-type Fe3+-hydroxamate transport system substrate-binding protein
MQKKEFIDQLDNRVEINFPPKRIISLVPSQTELLFDLGLDQEIVGITKFCIHPKDKFKSTAKIGGTKKLNIQKIRDLKPDLIIGNKEENQKEDIEILMKEFPVWMSDIFDLKDALQMIKSVGEIVNKKDEANSTANEIENKFKDLKHSTNIQTPRNVLYFIWQNPNMLAGQNTFINEMVTFCGLKNIIQEHRYPALNKDELEKLTPEVVLLSSEPFPFKQKHIEEYQEIWPNSKVMLIDGEMFSWYGSRLLKSAEYFKSLIKSLL